MNIPANLSPYWVLLKDLSPKEKLSLIEILAKSIQSGSDTSKKGNKKIKSPIGNDWVQQFSGSWADFPESAEEMIHLIESTRTLSRQIESL